VSRIPKGIINLARLVEPPRATPSADYGLMEPSVPEIDPRGTPLGILSESISRSGDLRARGRKKLMDAYSVVPETVTPEKMNPLELLGTALLGAYSPQAGSAFLGAMTNARAQRNAKKQADAQTKAAREQAMLKASAESDFDDAEAVMRDSALIQRTIDQQEDNERAAGQLELKAQMDAFKQGYAQVRDSVKAFSARINNDLPAIRASSMEAAIKAAKAFMADPNLAQFVEGAGFPFDVSRLGDPEYEAGLIEDAKTLSVADLWRKFQLERGQQLLPSEVETAKAKAGSATLKYKESLETSADRVKYEKWRAEFMKQRSITEEQMRDPKLKKIWEDIAQKQWTRDIGERRFAYLQERNTLIDSIKEDDRRLKGTKEERMRMTSALSTLWKTYEGLKADSPEAKLVMDQIETIQDALLGESIRPPAQKAATIARGYMGTEYKWGEESKSGTDCSGLVCSALKEAGFNVGRTTAQGLYDSLPGDWVIGGPDNAKRVSVAGIPVPVPMAGDIVFFYATGKTGGKISHTGIVDSVDEDGNIIFTHASRSAGKVIQSKMEGYYLKHLAGIKRPKKK
jgi:hypothetical protein